MLAYYASLFTIMAYSIHLFEFYYSANIHLLRFFTAQLYTFLRFLIVPIYTFLRFFASVTLKTYWWCYKTVIICDYIFVCCRIFIYSS